MQSTTQNGVISIMPSYISNHNADLVLGRQRHHRDLFTGSLGIPDVTTHVGSVIHAFETLARSQKTDSLLSSTKYKNLVDTGEQPYELSGSVRSIKNVHNFTKSTEQVGKSIPSPSGSLKKRKPIDYCHTLPQSKYQQMPYQYHYYDPPYNRPPNSIAAGGITLSPSTLSPLSSAAQPITSTSSTFYTHGNPSYVSTPNTAVSSNNNVSRDRYVKNSEAFYHPKTEKNSNNLINIVDDYRKNLFGTHPKLDGKIFSPTNCNYDNINFRDFVDKHSRRQQRPISVPEYFYNSHRLLDEKSDLIYGHQHHHRHLSNYRPTSVQIQSFKSTTDRNPHFDQITNVHQHDCDDNEPDDFLLRGTTVSQSFIKNVKNNDINRRYPPSYSNSTTKKSKTTNYGNFHLTNKTLKRQKSEEQNDDDLRKRYSEHNNESFDEKNSKRRSFKPKTQNQAII